MLPEVQEYIDTNVIIGKVKGEGIVIDWDASNYEEIIEELDSEFTEIEDYFCIYHFNNDMPYYVATGAVIIGKKSTKELFVTNDTKEILFKDYDVILLKENAGGELLWLLK